MTEITEDCIRLVPEEAVPGCLKVLAECSEDGKDYVHRELRKASYHKKYPRLYSRMIHHTLTITISMSQAELSAYDTSGACIKVAKHLVDMSTNGYPGLNNPGTITLSRDHWDDIVRLNRGSVSADKITPELVSDVLGVPVKLVQ